MPSGSIDDVVDHAEVDDARVELGIDDAPQDSAHRLGLGRRRRADLGIAGIRCAEVGVSGHQQLKQRPS